MGKGVPETIRTSRIARSGRQTILFPVQLSSSMVFIVRTPIVDPQDHLIGVDFMVVPISRLDRLFPNSEWPMPPARVFIGALRQRQHKHFQIAPINSMQADSKTTHSDSYKAGRNALRLANRKRAGVVLPRKDNLQIAFYQTLRSTNWAIALSIDSNQSTSVIRRSLLDVISAVALLGLAVTAMFSILLRMFFRDIFRLELLQRAIDLQLLVSLKQKDLLLKEIHHRVKNNLQMISSIFNLQRHATTNAEVAVQLEDSQSRIQSIALLHETLYCSQDLSKISMQDYMERLLAHNMRSLSKDAFILGSVHAQGVSIHLDRAFPCGLLVNELVTNALKHAFPPSYTIDQRMVSIKLALIDAETVELEVVDNGIGASAALLSGQGHGSLGVQLVHALSRQLDGVITVKIEGGTSFRLAFPIVARAYS